jgi:hypothetical protein
MSEHVNDIEEDVFPLSPLFDEYDDYIEYLADDRAAFRKMAQRDRMERQRLHRSMARARDAHFIQEIGKYITPETNTWESYSAAVREGDLGFDPAHSAFDKALADACGIRALYDPSAGHYKDYEPLRHNLAVLRNYLINHFYGAEIDAKEAQDPNRIAYLQQIGKELGAMLHRGQNPVAKCFGFSLSAKDLNVEHRGAAEIYKTLLRAQKTHNVLSPFLYVLNFFSSRRAANS